MIRFNVPFITGKESGYINDAIQRGRLAGDGHYTELCKAFFARQYGFPNNYLTTSGTDALEMAAILMDIKNGDEVIMPSYTFVSTANAFVLRGAKIVFADSLRNHPNLDHESIESLITNRTKAIVVVHYAGVSCEMDTILAIANRYNLIIVEDAAQAINAFYKGKVLGGLGDYGTFSFHETKNIGCGEGGLLVVKDDKIGRRAEIIREKGTNRSAFFRGEIDKYGWVDIGSSFLPSELSAAFLYAQLESLIAIQEKRKNIWLKYFDQLKSLEDYGYELPHIPSYVTHNFHIFYVICPDLNIRTRLIEFLNKKNIKAVFHYLPLHNSTFYKSLNHDDREVSLPNADRYADVLVRLPLYPDLTEADQSLVIDTILKFAKS